MSTSWRSLYTVLKGILFLLFLAFALRITTESVICFSILCTAVYFTPKNKVHIKTNTIDISKMNPFKRSQLEDPHSHLIQRATTLIENFATFDAEFTTSLKRFSTMQLHSQCLFARHARLWGSREWDKAYSLDYNILRNIGTLLKFTIFCKSVGLQGFLFELPGEEYGKNIKAFSAAVKRTLQVISDSDPAKFSWLDGIEERGWVFEFNRITFFVTTFAPLYPSNHQRYNHGLQDCYILLQPELSFAQQDIPPDTPKTQWNKPKTVRDRIRVAFKNAGRPMYIRDTLSYPMAHDIVKGLQPEEIIEWWK